MILCGMSELTITPVLGSVIPGYYHIRHATLILDDLYAKAIVFDDGNTSIAAVSVDMICITPEQTEAIRFRAHRLTSIPRENITVSATHTITGGPSVDWSKEMLADPAYVAYFTARAADAIVIAFNNRKLCEIGWGLGRQTQLSFNRRYLMSDGTVMTNPGACRNRIVQPDGPIDPEIGIIRIDDYNGDPVGLIVNFACHLDTVGGSAVSADYTGQLSQQLKSKLGQEFICLFLLGACGDVNHIDFMSEGNVHPEHYKWMGQELSTSVYKAWSCVAVSEVKSISFASNTIKLHRRAPSDIQQQEAKHLLLATEYDKEKLTAFDALQIDRFYAECISQIASDPGWSNPVQLEIQAFRIGGMALLSIPGEYFAEFGLSLKAKSQFPFTLINTQANGNFGYIPTERAFRTGGFEPRLCHWSFLEEGAGRLIEDEAIRLLNTLYDNKGE